MLASYNRYFGALGHNQFVREFYTLKSARIPEYIGVITAHYDLLRLSEGGRQG